MFTSEELRKKNSSELQKELRLARENSLKSKIATRMGQDKKTTSSKKNQHYVAQILTALNVLNREEAPKTV